MDSDTKDRLAQFDKLLEEGNQSWLFGAGISFGAGIPLMGALTQRVFQLAELEGGDGDKVALDAIEDGLAEDSHIEHILSHIGDVRAIAERSKDKSIKIGAVVFTLDELDAFHQRILAWIGRTVRLGYISESAGVAEKIGTRDEPAVDIKNHESFVSALFYRGHAGMVERRHAVRIFTTNYDTLLEDALALKCLSYWDGFTGGAVAFRSHRYGEDEPKQGYRAHLIKLHGSIDWHLGKEGRVWRVRDDDQYPEKASRVLIYPQSTKYLATQRDPFAAQFDLFRRALGAHGENVLITCGYSFGDEHINQEIKLSMERPENKTTLIVFSMSLNGTLELWRKSAWGKRIYILTEGGLYVGKEGPFSVPDAGKKHDWWKFEGATKILMNGAEAYCS
jgi:hypothetical protein